MKIATNIARVLSAIFSPLLMGTYGVILAMWFSYLYYSPDKAKLIVTAVTFVATCILPIISIYLLSRTGVIKDPLLKEREGRFWPYMICSAGYAATGVYYYFVHAPVWLSMFVVGGAVALIVLAIVNSRWKISGHAAGTGGLCAMIFFLMCSGNSAFDLRWEFVAAVILAGCVCTSRLILERHTLMQVAAGFLTGFVCVFLPAWFMQGASIPYFQ